jgi:hypothetical protein
MSLPFPIASSLYTRYELTPQMEREGYHFSITSLAVLNNLRATIAEEKIKLPFTPDNVLEYTQQEAYKTGQLDILDHLIQQAESFEIEAAQLTQGE